MNKELKKYFKKIGRIGGSSTSEAKAKAAKENGKKGGRPRKGGLMKKILLILLIASTTVGCRGLRKLTGETGSDQSSGPQSYPVIGDSNVTPVYDHATATQLQDSVLVSRAIASTITVSALNLYIYNKSDAGAHANNGYSVYDMFNGLAPTHSYYPDRKGVNSVLVDAWKAMFRAGYFDSSLLNDPSVLTNNSYPFPVYQGDPADYGY